MKTLLALLALALTVVCDARKSSSLPHPWLTLDRSAKVLRLVCRPPPQALDPTSSWQFVDDLRLLAFLPQHNFISNVSLVNMASSWKEPQANPKFSISRTSFQGTWSSKSVSLEFLLPVTNKELGHYFCEVAYRDKNDKIRTFATRAAVDENFIFSHVKTQPRTEQNFEVSVSDAHKVHVTWTKPEQSRFIQASVSFELVGEGGQSMSPLISLFATDGDTDSKYGSGVLLKKVNNQDGNNMSIILFVKRDQQKADYRYGCWVPYPSCRGEDKVFCTCCQQGNNPDRQVCLTAAGVSETYFSGSITFAVPLAIACLLLVVCGSMYALFKTGRCSQSTFLQKVFTPRREMVSALEDGKHRPSAGSLSKVPLVKESSQITRKLLPSIDAPCRQNDKERDKTAGDNMRKDRRADRRNNAETIIDDDIDNKQPLVNIMPSRIVTSNTSGPEVSEMDRDIH